MTRLFSNEPETIQDSAVKANLAGAMPGGGKLRRKLLNPNPIVYVVIGIALMFLCIFIGEVLSSSRTPPARHTTVPPAVSPETMLELESAGVAPQSDAPSYLDVVPASTLPPTGSDVDQVEWLTFLKRVYAEKGERHLAWMLDNPHDALKILLALRDVSASWAEAYARYAPFSLQVEVTYGD